MHWQEINKKVGGLDVGNETEVRVKTDKGVSLSQAVSTREAGW